MGIPVIYVYQIGSTNDYLKENWRSVDDLTVIRAATQTRGRGRLQRTWDSSAGGLWISVLFKEPSNPPHHYQRLVGITLLETVEKFLENERAGKCVYLKWPNDLVVLSESGGLLKLAGILQENIYQPGLCACIVGTGLNVNNVLPPDIREKAITLKELLTREIPLDQLFSFFLERLPVRLGDPEAVIDQWNLRSFIKPGQRIDVYSETDHRIVSGTVTDIPMERLDMIDETGTSWRFFAGDVRIMEVRR
jgi:BirA family biotin operon repressor/biotin-[acetyl-CoA-carboxylase] ligase